MIAPEETTMPHVNRKRSIFAHFTRKRAAFVAAAAESGAAAFPGPLPPSTVPVPLSLPPSPPLPSSVSRPASHSLGSPPEPLISGTTFVGALLLADPTNCLPSASAAAAADAATDPLDRVSGSGYPTLQTPPTNASPQRDSSAPHPRPLEYPELDTQPGAASPRPSHAVASWRKKKVSREQVGTTQFVKILTPPPLSKFLSTLTYFPARLGCSQHEPCVTQAAAAWDAAWEAHEAGVADSNRQLADNLIGPCRLTVSIPR